MRPLFTHLSQQHWYIVLLHNIDGTMHMFRIVLLRACIVSQWILQWLIFQLVCVSVEVKSPRLHNSLLCILSKSVSTLWHPKLQCTKQLYAIMNIRQVSWLSSIMIFCANVNTLKCLLELFRCEVYIFNFILGWQHNRSTLINIRGIGMSELMLTLIIQLLNM
jgi:hypothetical protein